MKGVLGSFLERLANLAAGLVNFLLDVFAEVLDFAFELVENLFAVFGVLVELLVEFVVFLVELFLDECSNILKN